MELMKAKQTTPTLGDSFFLLQSHHDNYFFLIMFEPMNEILRNLECSPYMKEHGWLQTLLCVHPFVGEELPV